MVPKSWEKTVTPGSIVSLNITTSSEQDKVLGIAQVASSETQITENLLRQTADGIKAASPELANASLDVAVISPQQGIITIIRNGIIYQGWVISNKKGTYILTLAPGYTPEKQGIPLNKTQPPKFIIVEGTATEQVQAIVNLWLNSTP